MATSITISSCLLLSVMIAHTLICGIVEGRRVVVEEKEKLIKHKYAVKTVQSEDGDIFDCVDIYKQPALDHPLLKNHKIQMSPGAIDDSGIENMQPLLKPVNCPERTIPILRTQKSDSRQPNSETDFDPNQTEVALAYTTGEMYTGLDALINVWNPKVEVPAEASGAFIWAQSNSNSFGGGWMVAPSIYGDNNTRFSIFWTNDNYISGCYNLRCAGFVQVSSDIVIGGILDPVSRVGDPKQKVFYLRIFKDKSSGDWWLNIQNTLLGYWPKTIFANMADMADKLFWGGKVINTKRSGRHTLTEMGSGHFPGDGFSKASYMHSLRIMDNNFALRMMDEIWVTKTNIHCYDLEVGSDRTGSWGTHFFYGGSGNSSQCK